jgi:hypothetical protein
VRGEEVAGEQRGNGVADLGELLALVASPGVVGGEGLQEAGLAGGNPDRLGNGGRIGFFGRR